MSTLFIRFIANDGTDVTVNAGAIQRIVRLNSDGTGLVFVQGHEHGYPVSSYEAFVNSIYTGGVGVFRAGQGSLDYDD